jgi:hypothetical protein
VISNRPDRQILSIPAQKPEEIEFSSRALKVIRIGGAVLVVAAAVVIAYLTASDLMVPALLLAALPITIIALLFLLYHFDWFPVIILGLGLFAPFSLPTGTGSRLVLSLAATLLFAGYWLLRVVTRQIPLKFVPSPVNLPILGFNIVVVFSLVWSIFVRDPTVTVWSSFVFVQIASAVVMVASTIALLLVTNWISSTGPLKFMVAMMIIAGYLALPNLFMHTNLPVNSQGMFNLWVVTLAAGQLLFNKSLNPMLKVGCGIIIAMILYYSFGLHRDWLAGWVPVFTALGVLGLLRSIKIGAVMGLVLLVLFAVFYIGPSLEAETQISGITRVAAWEMNWRITSQHLLLGTGPGGYTAYYMTYFPTEAMATHSNYIDLIAQLGIIGFGFFVWIFVVCVQSGLRLWRKLASQRSFEEGLGNAALAGAIGCIVIMAFGDWVIPFAYTQTIMGYSYSVYNWLFIGTIFALDRLAAVKGN